jgi:RNA polymerase-binding transcription factor DksA
MKDAAATSGSATSGSARTTAKAAGSVKTTKAAATKPAGANAASSKPVPAKAEATTAAPSKPAPSKPATAKPAAAKAAPSKPAAAKAVAAKAVAAKAAATKAAATKPAQSKVAPAQATTTLATTKAATGQAPLELAAPGGESLGKALAAAAKTSPRVASRRASGTTAAAEGGAATSGEAVDVTIKVADAQGRDGAAGRDAGREALPVCPGELSWTGGELASIRDELSGELARMDLELAALQMNIDDVLRDSGDGVGDDQADSGAKAFEREQGMALLATVRESRFQTERALGRIGDGTYGLCESCGGTIGKERLQAYPRATLCVDCKQRQERR